MLSIPLPFQGEKRSFLRALSPISVWEICYFSAHCPRNLLKLVKFFVPFLKKADFYKVAPRYVAGWADSRDAARGYREGIRPNPRRSAGLPRRNPPQSAT